MTIANLLLPKFSFSLSKFLQMRLNSFLFRFLPFSISRIYIMALGKLYYLLNWKEADLIRKAIHYIFRRKFSVKVMDRKIKRAFKGIFDHYHEKLFVGYSNFPRLIKFLKTRVALQGEDELKEAMAAGKGVLLVTGHYGAVEFLPGALALNGYPVSMICRFQTTRLRTSLGRRAAAVGLDLIDADDGNIVLNAMKALKNGRILITEVDEFDEWRTDPHRNLYFLNCKLESDRTLELLQKRSGAPVVTALMNRGRKKSYTCALSAVDNAEFPSNMPIGERCLTVLESMVEENPEQWYQWKKFSKMIKSHLEVEDEYYEAGYLAPEFGFSVAD